MSREIREQKKVIIKKILSNPHAVNLNDIMELLDTMRMELYEQSENTYGDDDMRLKGKLNLIRELERMFFIEKS